MAVTVIENRSEGKKAHVANHAVSMKLVPLQRSPSWDTTRVESSTQNKLAQVYKYLLIGCLIVFNPSCRAQTSLSRANQQADNSHTNAAIEPPNQVGEPPELLEFFSNDSTVGRRRKNKIEIRSLARIKGRIFEVRFYSRMSGAEWNQRQVFELENNALMDCDPRIEDFNNDGFKDVTLISDQAARGSNEIRTLLIYDRKRDKLVLIKNSADYPNLAYNKKLNCIDAWLFYGATSTVFLKLEGDHLREFATVDTGLERIVTVIDLNGRRKVLSRKKMKADDIFTRYETFNPPR